MIKDNDLDFSNDFSGFGSGYFSAVSTPVITSKQICPAVMKRILVDKTTHRIRFEGETELSVVVVIEPKEGL